MSFLRLPQKEVSIQIHAKEFKYLIATLPENKTTLLFGHTKFVEVNWNSSQLKTKTKKLFSINLFDSSINQQALDLSTC